MGIETILALLTAERDKLTLAIDALQGPTKRQGRPPKKPAKDAVDYSDPEMPEWVKPKAFRQEMSTPTSKRKPRTAAQRKAHGLRMKAFWAAKRKTEAKSSAAPESTRKKRTFTAAQRRRQGERMKAFWAAKRKAQVKSEAKPKAVRAKTATAA